MEIKNIEVTADRITMYVTMECRVSEQTVIQFMSFCSKNWKPYILNAFDCPYSNGFTEGSNNKIKVLKHIAFGYRSFHNFRSRIHLTS